MWVGEVAVAEPEPRLLAVALELALVAAVVLGDAPALNGPSIPASVYMTVSWSGQTSSPWRSRSSAVLTTTRELGPDGRLEPARQPRPADPAGELDDAAGSDAHGRASSALRTSPIRSIVSGRTARAGGR